MSPDLASPAWAATAHYELDRLASAASLMRASLERFRRVLKPGPAASVAAMAEADLDSLEGRLAWLRTRIEAEAEGRVA
jgi:hypothetical protein